jgi:hypothetical protein
MSHISRSMAKLCLQMLAASSIPMRSIFCNETYQVFFARLFFFKTCNQASNDQGITQRARAFTNAKFLLDARVVADSALTIP